jgi:predicted CXXCH cytochrome family protein
MLGNRLDILRSVLSRARSLQAAVAWGLGLGLLAVVGLRALYPYPAGPRQPIPFSHYRHAGIRGISCLFCHDGADRSQTAGMPPIAKCLLCHNRIAPHFAPLRKLHEAAASGRPVQWVRVYRLADFVYFNHEAHLIKSIDCAQCHGDVKAMNRLVLNQRLTMGFCVNCHRRPEYNASVDCYRCHR